MVYDDGDENPLRQVFVSLYECPRCGYLTGEISFDHCPFCGCKASSEYGVVANTMGVTSPDSGDDKPPRGYGGLFLFDFSGETPPLMPYLPPGPLARAIAVAPSPLGPHLRDWYSGLSSEKRMACEESMAHFLDTTDDNNLNVSPDDRTEYSYAKALEIIFYDTERVETSQACSTCTFYLGFSRCYFTGTIPFLPAPSEGGPCPLYARQVDQEMLRRRLAFRRKMATNI